MDLQDSKIRLIQLTAVRKINHTVTKTGAIVISKYYKGANILKSIYEKGKIKIIDKDGKTVEIVDTVKKPVEEIKQATKKKSKDDKTSQNVSDITI